MISCKAYLKRLNITQPMAEALLPQMRLATAPRSGGCSLGQGAAGRHYEQLFKSEISLVDSTGRKCVGAGVWGFGWGWCLRARG